MTGNSGSECALDEASASTMPDNKIERLTSCAARNLSFLHRCTIPLPD